MRNPASGADFIRKSLSFRVFLVKSFFSLFVSFLIVSAGFLILSADSLIVPADAIRKSAHRKVAFFALSLSCSILRRLWEGKSRKSVDNFNPRRSTKGAKEHESVLVLGQIGLV